MVNIFIWQILKLMLKLTCFMLEKVINYLVSVYSAIHLSTAALTAVLAAVSPGRSRKEVDWRSSQ